MYIRPVLDPLSEVEGARLKLRDPVTMMRVPDEGMFVPDLDPHWLTMIRFGDAEVISPPASPKAVSAAEPLPEIAAEPPASTEEHV